jgi:hypothetical protein
MTIYQPHERPEVEVLVDGTWYPASCAAPGSAAAASRLGGLGAVGRPSGRSGGWAFAL